jgi:hypothetical protein
MSRITLVAVALGGVALFGLGWRFAPSSAPAMHARSQPAPATAPPRVAAPSEIDVLRGEIRAAVRPAPAPALAAEESAPDTGADDAAGLEVVETALRSGRWTAADRRALRGQMGAMSVAAREEALRQLVLAINAGELRPEPGAPLL